LIGVQMARQRAICAADGQIMVHRLVLDQSNARRSCSVTQRCT
jgi:hypothetical protein